jgi:hypothetical protein
MPYLVCDRCGGYYELQAGESPEDFSDKCECGGHLSYVEDLNEADGLNEVCPNCGSVIEGSEGVCPNCGFELAESELRDVSEKQLIFGFLWVLSNAGILTIMALFFGGVFLMGAVGSIFKPTGLSIYSVIEVNLVFGIITFCLVMVVFEFMRRFKINYLSRYEKKNLNWLAISVAFLFSLVSFFGGEHLPGLVIVGPLVGGFIAGFIVGKSYLNGLVNGGIPAGIGGFIGVIIFILTFTSNAGESLDTLILVNLIVGILAFIPIFLIGSIGGMLGAGIRKKFSP